MMISGALDTTTGSFVRVEPPAYTLEPVEVVGRRPPRFDPTLLLLLGAVVVLLMLPRKR